MNTKICAIIILTVPATRGIPAEQGQPKSEQGNLTGMWETASAPRRVFYVLKSRIFEHDERIM